jgi:Fe-S-cluster-containing hydrogenase component 2
MECPVGAISEADDIFVIDAAACVECEGYADTNQCIDVCPVEAVVLN